MNENTRILQFLAFAFVWSWGFFILAALASHDASGAESSSTPLIIAGTFGPTLAAIYFTFRQDRIGAVLRLLRDGFRFRMPPFVAVFVVVVPLAVASAGQIGAGNGEVSIEATLPIVFIVVFFLGGSFGEEFGWRGYLLPRLLEERSAFSASFLIAAVWALWHLPLFWVKGTSQFTTPFWLYVVYIAALSIQYKWVYLRTGGSVFACMLLHTFTNITVTVFPIAVDSDQLPRFATETILSGAVSMALVAAGWKEFTEKGSLNASRDDNY